MSKSRAHALAEDPGRQLAPDPMLKRKTKQHQLDMFAGSATFEECCEHFLSTKTDVKTTTIAEYTSATRRVWAARPHLAALDVADVDVVHMIEIHELLLPTRGAHRAARCAMAQALDYAARLGLRADANPARTRVAVGYKHRSKRPSKELIAGFLPAVKAVADRGEIQPIVADFFAFAVLTGFRHREIIRLRVGDVDLDPKHPSVIITMKSRGPRISVDEEMPVGPMAAAILARRIEHASEGWLFPSPSPHREGHWRGGYAWEQWPPILLELEAMGIDVLDRVMGTKIVPTVTRSIAARIRSRAGIPMIVAQASMGHRRLQTTMSYAPSLVDEVRNAMQITELTVSGSLEHTPPKGAGASRSAERDNTDDADRRAALAQRIKAARERMGIGQGPAAALYTARTGLPLTRQGWRYWEMSGCGLEQIDAVAGVLGTTVRSLLGFDLTTGDQ